MRHGLRAASYLFVVLASALGTAEAQTLLRWKLQPDQTLRYLIRQDMASNFELGGKPARMAVAQLLDVRWKVESVDADGAASFSQTIDRIRVKLEQTDQQAVEYDSASKEELQGAAKMLGSFFGLLVDRSIMTKVSSQGEVLDFHFPADVLEKLKQLPGGGQLGTLLSEQGLKQMLDVMALPAEAVTPGKTWKRHSELNPPNLGKEDIDMSYTYTGPQTKDGRELEKLDLTVVMKFTPDAKQQILAEIKEQDTTGSIYFDNVAGYLVQSEATSKLQMHFSMQGNKFNQAMEIESRMNLVPEGAK
jgi:hypothetical protein